MSSLGLGKTLQALGLAHYYLADWPLLILTPSSMKFAWDEAVKVWLPSVPLHHIQVCEKTKKNEMFFRSTFLFKRLFAQERTTSTKKFQ